MALVLGLWSLKLEPGKTHSQSTTPAIQITNVSFGDQVKGDGRSAVLMKYTDFESDDEDDEDDDEDDDDDEEDSEGNPIKLPNTVTKETVLAVLKPNVTESTTVNINLVEDTEIVELSVSGENPVYLTGHYIRQEDFDQDPYYDSDDDSEIDSDMEDLIDDDDEEDEEMLEGRIEEIVSEGPAASKKETAVSKKRAAQEDEDESDNEVAPKLVPAATNGKASVDTDGLSKNQKKKLAKKLKASNGEAAPAPAPAPAAKAAEPAKEKKDKKPTPTSQTLPGGLVITDAKKGDGPTAKPGKRVSMRYIGKLENGKVFDSNTKGAPLSFILGRGEVISGWDKGIVGMAVGGERKLVIPPSMAYGKKGTSGIPGNSTLHFEVKLVAIK